MTLDDIMNDRILTRLGKLPNRDSVAKGIFRQSGLVGIEGEEAIQIQEALLSHWSDKDGFVKVMEGQFDRSEKEWAGLWDNEQQVAYSRADMVKATQRGATTKSWIVNPEDSTSGPCEICQALASENQDVPLGDPFSNSEDIAFGHVGCVCSTRYSNGKEE